jgi:hypothetical protein
MATLCVGVVSETSPAEAPWPMAMSDALKASAPPAARELSPWARLKEPSAVLASPADSAPVPTAMPFVWLAIAL